MMEFHPIAECFKLLDGTAFEDLVADIRDRGVIQPIVVYEGKILDGRNRYRAAVEAGIPCPTTAYVGDDPIRHVVGLNHMRRHESDVDRALAASKLASLAAGFNQHNPKEVSSFRADLSLQEAADLVGVSKAKVKRARTIEERGTDELKEAVRNGSVSLTRGGEIARLPSDQQAEKMRQAVEGEAPAADAKINRGDPTTLKQLKMITRQIFNLPLPEEAAREMAGIGVGVFDADDAHQASRWLLSYADAYETFIQRGKRHGTA